MKYYIILVLSVITSLQLIGQGFNKNEPIIEYPHAKRILNRGLINKLKISVPKVDSILVFDENKKQILKDSLGYYKIYVLSSNRANEKRITVRYYIGGVEFKSEEVEFEIKETSRPIVSINGNSGHHLKMYVDEFKNAKLKVSVTDFIYNEFIETRRFRIKIGDEESINVVGDSITDEIYNKIEKLGVGGKVLIYTVGFSTANRTIVNWRYCKNLAPLYIELIARDK